MKRRAIAIVLVAACSGSVKNESTTTGGVGGSGAGSGSGSGAAIYAKKMAISWGITQGESSADMYLQATDETGKQVSYPLGTYPGHCTIITPAAAMSSVTGVACIPDAGGPTIELDAAISGDEVVVLKSAIPPGATPDPMAREEVTRIKAPSGAAIQVGP